MNDDKPALSAEELYERYLLRRPGNVSDLVFVMSCRKEREDKVQPQ